MDNSGTMRSEGVGVETLVLVLTDVQGSTKLWQDEPVAMDAAMARHHEIVHGAVAEHSGWRPVDQGEGDAVFAAFGSPSEAVTAVIQIQQALAAEPWPTSIPLTVRIGVHVGEVTERNGNLYGDPVNRCARLRGLGAGGQTLLSAPVYELVRDKLPPGTSVTDLGQHRMKDLTRPEHVWQLDLDGLATDFPPLSSLDRVRHNLPIQTTPFIGREAELDQLVAALREHRLVTLTGFGGMGKTRIALQAAAEFVGDPVAGEVFFVDLSGVEDHADVPARVAEATGTTYDDDPLGSLVAAWGSTPVLLVLDNLEQVLGCATFVAALLSRTSAVRVLGTSREALRVRAERVIPLDPMPVPSSTDARDAATLDTFEAVQLFLDRAQAVKPDFAVTNENAPAVAAVCARLDGHPLALELAAARLRMMSVESLQTRLDSALKVLTGGSRDMPERHQTLRATIAWSYDGLDDDERLLLARMSCLPGAADFEMVEAACGAGLDVLTSLEVLVDRSLVRTTYGEVGAVRYGLLVSIRDYADEQLDADQGAIVQDRHAAYITTLAPQAVEVDWDDVVFVKRELVHVRAALNRLARSTDPGPYTQLVVDLATGLTHNGLPVEAQAHLEAALAHPAPASTRARLLRGRVFAVGCTDPQLVSEFLDAARASGDDLLLGSALSVSMAAATTTQELYDATAKLDGLHARLELKQSPDVRDMRAEYHQLLSGRLRHVDPERACQVMRDSLNAGKQTGHGVERVRLVRILLDHGLTTVAETTLTDWDDPADVNGLLNWHQNARAERARLLGALGDPAAGTELAQDALDLLIASRLTPYFAAVVACSSYAATGQHDNVVRAADAGLLGPSMPGGDASLTWRRAHAHLHLGRADHCRTDLAASRQFLAADELGGPRELLGCLITEALLVHEEDPARAARILGSVEGHRTTNLGRWVLPHSTDRDADHLSALLLPAHGAAYAEGLALTPQDLVRGAPL